MEQSREIYWNVGSGVLFPMYLFASITAALFLYGHILRWRRYSAGKKYPRPQVSTRQIVAALVTLFTQAKVWRGSLSGLAHALLFWSFLILLAGTTLIFIQADFSDPLFDYRFLKGRFYLLFSLFLDLGGAIAIIASGALFIRRYLFPPEDLDSEWMHGVVYALIFATLLTGFWVEGLRMAVTEVGKNESLAVWSPVGLMVAKIFSGWSEVSLKAWHSTLWWIHMFISFSLIAIIPYTALRHLVNAPVSVAMADQDGIGHIDTIDMEDETRESYGVGEVADLAWKDLLEADTCVGCVRCQNRCPAFRSGKTLSPMRVINQIEEAAIAGGASDLVGKITSEAIWDCVACGACHDICPVGVEHVGKIMGMRQNLALMEGVFPGDEVARAMNAVEVNGNPLGMTAASREEWATGLDNVAILGEEKTELLYFAGCYASFDSRNQKVAQSLMNILSAAGIRVSILGKNEKCCGEPVRKMGNEYLYQQVAVANVERINKSGASTILTSCPHCYTTLNREYRDFGLEPGVEHAVVYIERLIREGMIKLDSSPIDATYHDSCTLGRINDIFEEPRSLLGEVGVKITEMEEHGRDGFCCGAGGGRILADEHSGDRINELRVKMASATGASSLISSCPFCLTMFEDGVKSLGLTEEISPKDIAEIVSERLYSS